MPKTCQTLGTVEADREIDALWKAALAVSNAATNAANATSQQITVTRQASLNAQTASGSVVLQGVQGIEIDDSVGLTLTADGALAEISRAAATGTPTAIATAGSAGTSPIAANKDHTHALTLAAGTGIGVSGFTLSNTGVTALAVAGGLVSESGTTGSVTITVSVPMVTSDPGSPAAGDLWYRTDTNNLSIYTGSAIKRVAMA